MACIHTMYIFTYAMAYATGVLDLIDKLVGSPPISSLEEHIHSLTQQIYNEDV